MCQEKIYGGGGDPFPQEIKSDCLKSAACIAPLCRLTNLSTLVLMCEGLSDVSSLVGLAPSLKCLALLGCEELRWDWWHQTRRTGHTDRNANTVSYPCVAVNFLHVII